MAKTYTVRQSALVAGAPVSCTFNVPNVEEAELTSILALLEGGYEVVEVNETLSSMTNAEVNAVASNPISYIGMYGAQNQSARISGFGGKPIHFKNTATGDDIRNVLKTIKPFPLLPTETPQTISMKASERVL